MILDPDDDDDNYLTPPAQGKKLKVGTGTSPRKKYVQKKKKVGIGYAGDQKEDVGSPSAFALSKLILMPNRPLDKPKPRQSSTPKMKNWGS